MSLSWLDPKATEDPLSLRNKDVPSNTMYMQTISAEDRVKKESTRKQTRDVMRSTWQLDGSTPKPRTHERTRVPEEYLAEVPGSKPKSLVKERRTDVDRVERAQSRQSENPLYQQPAGAPAAPRQSGRLHVQHVRDAERGDMPSMVVPHPSHPDIEPPRFVRDQQAELLEVEGSHPKPPVDTSRPARDIMWERNIAVEGSSPGWKKKHIDRVMEEYGSSDRTGRLNPMDVKDINEDGVFHTKRVTNPLEPAYVFDDGEEMNVGPVNGSRPRAPPKPKDGPQSSLYTEDIQGPKKYATVKTGPRRDPRKLVLDPKFTMEPTMMEPEEWAEKMKETLDAPTFGRKVVKTTSGVAGLIQDTPEPEYPDTPRSEPDDTPSAEEILPPRPASVADGRIRLRGPFAVPPTVAQVTTKDKMSAAGRPSNKAVEYKPRARGAARRDASGINSITGRPMTGIAIGDTGRKTLTSASLSTAGRLVTPRKLQLNMPPSDTRMVRERREAEYREDVESVRSLRF